VKALARAKEDEVLAAWAGLGYYARAATCMPRENRGQGFGRYISRHAEGLRLFRVSALYGGRDFRHRL